MNVYYLYGLLEVSVVCEETEVLKAGVYLILELRLHVDLFFSFLLLKKNVTITLCNRQLFH